MKIFSAFFATVLTVLFLVTGSPAATADEVAARSSASCESALTSVRKQLVGNWVWYTPRGRRVELFFKNIAADCSEGDVAFSIDGSYQYNRDPYPWKTAVGTLNDDGELALTLKWGRGIRYSLTLQDGMLVGTFVGTGNTRLSAKFSRS